LLTYYYFWNITLRRLFMTAEIDLGRSIVHLIPIEVGIRFKVDLLPQALIDVFAQRTSSRSRIKEVSVMKIMLIVGLFARHQFTFVLVLAMLLEKPLDAKAAAELAKHGEQPDLCASMAGTQDLVNMKCRKAGLGHEGMISHVLIRSGIAKPPSSSGWRMEASGPHSRVPFTRLYLILLLTEDLPCHPVILQRWSARRGE
jgi:hypothetical protein